MVQTPLPVDYQYEDIHYVFNALKAGESCSLVGVGSGGKSNLMRHMIREDVQRRHLEGMADWYILVLLDPHNLIHLEATALEQVGRLWCGYELILNRLYRAVREIHDFNQVQPDKRRSIAKRISEAHNELFTSDPVIAQRGLRHLENALNNILRQDDRWRVVFLFDEIDEFKRLPPEFFLSLRGVRDQHKGRVMYITTSRLELDEIMMKPYDDRHQEVVEGFVELFHDHLRYISPLDEYSATFNIRRFINRYAHKYGGKAQFNSSQIDVITQELLKITGGHAGLIRRAYKPTIEYVNTVAVQKTHHQLLIDYVLDNSGVRKECETLIRSLKPEERSALYSLVTKGEIANSSTLRTLLDKNILYDDGERYDFRFKLLERLIHRNPDLLIAEVAD